jgi:cellobiose phosphorylase
LKSVEEHLVKTKENMVLLLTTPFNHSNLDPGYIKGYPPGVRENGGQYTHGSQWVPMAFARSGEGSKAVSLLQMMHPSAHTSTIEKCSHYKVEPYILVADIYDLEGQIGRGGWSWYTGSAGWLYRIWLEEVLGFKLRGTVLKLDCCIPKEWDGFKISYRYRTSVYEINVINPEHVEKGKVKLKLDGVELELPELNLVDDGKTHLVEVVIMSATG